MTRQSKAERELIAYTKKTFGEHLGDLLLCGYGEESAPSRRDFIVELADEGEAVTRVRLMLVAEGPAGTAPRLPSRKDPMVLLALIRLLMRGGGRAAADGGRHASGDVLALLGWDETHESLETVAASATTYFHTFYQLVKGLSGPGERASRDYTRKLRLFNGLGFRSKAEAGNKNDSMFSVAFNPEFDEALRRGELLGIDWKRVKGLRPLPLEFFNL